MLNKSWSAMNLVLAVQGSKQSMPNRCLRAEEAGEAGKEDLALFVKNTICL